MMLGLLGFLGYGEIIAIVLIILLLFGPSKLPQLGSAIGKTLNGFKREMKALDESTDATSPEASKDVNDAEIDVTPKEPQSKTA